MLQNLKLVVSNDQILPESQTLLPDGKSASKKVMSSNFTVIESKQKFNVDKAFNVKLKKYKNMQLNFTNACQNLISSYKSMKNVYVDRLTNKDDSKIEELDVIIKNIIEKQFGMQFPKLTASIKKDHQRFVSNFDTPISLTIDSSFKYSKLHLAIKEVYEYVSKIITNISDINMKYHFWLTMVIQPNEFHDLDDVREYLLQNMLDKEQTHVQLVFDTYFESLKYKLINVINEFNGVLDRKKYDESEDMELLIMDKKIKTFETKEEKLKNAESENCKKIKSLLGELAYRNRKLINAKNCLALLTKEKCDLISMIEKKEIKDKGFQSLQIEIEKEQEKNKYLRSIIEKETRRNE